MTPEVSKLRGDRNAKGMRNISPKTARKTRSILTPKNPQYAFPQGPNAKESSEINKPSTKISGDNRISTGAHKRAIHDKKGKTAKKAKT